MKTGTPDKTKLYFTKQHEDAIVEYTSNQDPKIRQHLYRTLIGPAFNEMVNKIVYTYKFNSLPNIDDLKEECKTWIITVLAKFDPTKGSKAFSYFSVITKNWFIHKVKKVNRQAKKEIFLDDTDEKRDINSKHLMTYNDYDKTRETTEFWSHLWVEIENWKKLELKPNEKKVLEAICILLEKPDAIEIFNKKAIYLYAREITGLNTKQVVTNLSRIRKKYKDFKKVWNDGDLS